MMPDRYYYEKIKINDLVLWTENPRDPIDENSTDEEVILKAEKNKFNKWNLDKFYKNMGEFYDGSEPPLVFIKNEKPIVYDGNRRVAVLKILQNDKLYFKTQKKLFGGHKNNLCDEKEIQCCVYYNEKDALISVKRKHSGANSWKTLEEEIFNAKFFNEESFFYKLDKITNLISNNLEILNQDFVKDEILTETNLKKMGILIINNNLTSEYSPEKVNLIFMKIIELIKKKVLYTRGKFRGKPKEAILEYYPDIFEKKALSNNIKDSEKNNGFEKNNTNNKDDQTSLTDFDNKKYNKRKGPNQKNETIEIFGEKLILKNSDTRDLYNDICKLDEYYNKYKKSLSKNFPNLIRMSLRLIVDTASENKLKPYIKKNYEEAKSLLSKDKKTYLSSQSITGSDKLIELLQVGAHKYLSNCNYEQTLAMSLIIGQIIQITHKR